MKNETKILETLEAIRQQTAAIAQTLADKDARQQEVISAVQELDNRPNTVQERADKPAWLVLNDDIRAMLYEPIHRSNEELANEIRFLVNRHIREHCAQAAFRDEVLYAIVG